MTTKELVEWAAKAEAAREKSWCKVKTEYRLNMGNAVTATRPKGATDVEHNIVTCLLYNCWNEVQDWCDYLKIPINW